MYIPKHYLESDKEEIINFIKTYSFATIITVEDNFQTATHLPFVVTQTENEIILTAHFAKANSQWTEILNNKVLVIFSEPHAYISPKYYNSKMNVPTWNYVSVHLYGTGKIITEQEQSLDLMEKMIVNFEEDYKTQWDSLPIEYKTRMLKGVVVFQITVTDIQAKKKLSQNKEKSERQRIISVFEKSNDNNEKSIAELIKKNEGKNQLYNKE
ncbi:FMN-binding negative transcriptional regulator [Gaetbulibacter sp. M235]|uniref:FMN-binding negative transcriptional regulator n=1 Tax=Gaetbulibacter sp. M235 TaxID=3126510 RepID=UPI00374E95D1